MPSVDVLLKHKINELMDHCAVKVREILRHDTHPPRFFAKKLSRCLSSLWQYGVREARSHEIMSMDQLKGFVEQLRSDGYGVGEWGEVDVVEMYPNIQKFIVPPAVEFFWKVMTATRFPGKTDIFFHVH